MNKQNAVCVTGASGFIASHIVEQLLERGYSVVGTVRDPQSASSAHLLRMKGASERLTLVAGDLLDKAAWPKIVAGASCVMHTASPYTLEAKDPQRDLVEPALEGTRNVLEACAAAGSVKRVVLTSSMASITDEPDEAHVLTEADWNERSSLTRNPYYYSKTVAEREAWRLYAEHSAHYSLVVINPFLVIGPSHTRVLNTSNALFSDLLSGKFPSLMRLVWGLVDVRDVARAHIEAMERPQAKGRHICAAGTISMRDAVQLLREKGYQDYALPTLGFDCAAGDYAIRMASYFQPKGVGSYLRTHVGRVPRFDNAKIQNELGLAFRPLEESIRDTAEDVIRHGHVKSPAVQVAAT